MKITRRHLRKIIEEAIQPINENAVIADLFRQGTMITGDPDSPMYGLTKEALAAIDSTLDSVEDNIRQFRDSYRSQLGSESPNPNLPPVNEFVAIAIKQQVDYILEILEYARTARDMPVYRNPEEPYSFEDALLNLKSKDI